MRFFFLVGKRAQAAPLVLWREKGLSWSQGREWVSEKALRVLFIVENVKAWHRNLAEWIFWRK